MASPGDRPYGGELGALRASWVRSMRARNLAPKTLRAYTDSLDQLVTHAGDTTLAALDRATAMETGAFELTGTAENLNDLLILIEKTTAPPGP